MVDQLDYAIRRATVADAEALAQVHDATWRETFAGLLSGQMLDALTADARAAVWRRTLSGETGELSTAYVAERDGAFVAFGSCGEQRDGALATAGYPGEFTAVYVLKSDQRRGLGAGLMSAMMSDLAGRGLVGFTCWAPRANIPARSLCEKLGGKLMGQREITLEHGVLNEVAYGWPKP